MRRAALSLPKRPRAPPSRRAHRRARGRRPRRDHDDGQGRRRQDDARRRDRERARRARASRAPLDDRSRRAHRRRRRRRVPRTSPSARIDPPSSRRASTPHRCWRPPAPSSTPTAARCSRRTCARRAPRRSRCSARSPTRGRRAEDGFVVARHRAHRPHACCCSTPPRPTTAKSTRHRRRAPTEAVAQTAAAPARPRNTRASLLVTLPEATPVHEAARLHARPPPRGHRARTRGSSTRASRRSSCRIRCSSRAARRKAATSRRSRIPTHAGPSSLRGRRASSPPAHRPRSRSPVPPDRGASPDPFGMCWPHGRHAAALVDGSTGRAMVGPAARRRRRRRHRPGERP